MSAEPTRVQDILGRALAQHVDPALQAAGLRRQGRRAWHRREGGGWVALGVEVDTYSTRAQMTLSVLTNARPTGTATPWRAGGAPPAPPRAFPPAPAVAARVSAVPPG